MNRQVQHIPLEGGLKTNTAMNFANLQYALRLFREVIAVMSQQFRDLGNVDRFGGRSHTLHYTQTQPNLFAGNNLVGQASARTAGAGRHKYLKPDAISSLPMRGHGPQAPAFTSPLCRSIPRYTHYRMGAHLSRVAL